MAHGLSVAPEFQIIKRLDSTGEWSTWTTAFGADSVIYLNAATAAEIGNNPDRFSVLPTASVFTPGDASNTGANNNEFISYCFHSVEGYSKVGSYEGNGNANGTFIYTGFRPAFTIVKNMDASANWQLTDDKRLGYNPDNNDFEVNNSDAEKTNDYIDIVSNGIKVRTTDSGYNTSNKTYIYIAFAKSPFKTSNAR